VLAIRGGLNATLIDPTSTVCGCKGCSCLAASYSSDGGSSWSVAEPNPTMHQPGCQAALLHASDGCTYLSTPGTKYQHDSGSPLHGGWCHGPRTPMGVRVAGEYSTCGRFNGQILRSGDGVAWVAAVNISVGEEFGT
jgi:hypothetical protein